MLPVELPKIEQLEPTGNPLDKAKIGRMLLLMEKNIQEKLIL